MQIAGVLYTTPRPSCLEPSRQPVMYLEGYELARLAVCIQREEGGHRHGAVSTTEPLVCFMQAQSSKEEAIASMQAFKAGLSKALASREESLRAGHCSARPLMSLCADSCYPCL